MNDGTFLYHKQTFSFNDSLGGKRYGSLSTLGILIETIIVILINLEQYRWKHIFFNALEKGEKAYILWEKYNDDKSTTTMTSIGIMIFL